MCAADRKQRAAGPGNVRAPAPRRNLKLQLLALLFVILWIGALAPRHLAKTDEGRYAEISREMVQSGDWLTPRLDDIKYFEKPALQYWATALADETFGLNEFSARLWTGLTGLMGVLATGLAARRVYGKPTAIAAVAVLASSMLYLLLGHVDTLDMGLTGFMTVTLGAMLASQFGETTGPPALVYLAWASAGLAVLSKGLIGLALPSAVAVLYILMSRDWQMFLRLRVVGGLLVLLVVAAPWFILVSRANPEFAHFFFIHEHVERFLTHEHNRVGPWWYFIPILAIGSLPWLTLLPQAVLVVRAPRASADPTLSRQARADRFLLLWAGFIFCFFSLSGSKLPSYILPIMPALALLIARAVRLAQPANLRQHARAVAALGVIGIGVGLYLPQTVAHADEVIAYTRLGYSLAAAALILLVGALYAAGLFGRGQRETAVLVLAGGGFIAGLTGLVGYDALDRFSSAQYIAAEIEPLMHPDTRLYSVEIYEQTLPFYLRHSMILVNHRDELDFGLNQEPDRWIPTLAAFAKAWQADASAIAVMPPTTLDKLRAMNLPMNVISADRRFVVVKKP